MYPGFAETARQECCGKIADVFMAVAVAAKQQDKR